MRTTRRALVIGGGIAGPVAAIFLARAGFEPIVFEAYPRTEDVGGGFQIAPNGLRVLAEIGVADDLLRQGHPSRDMAFRNHRGRLIGVVHTGQAGPAVNVRRAIVHRAVRAAAERAGVEIRYEKRLASVTTSDERAAAIFEDGTRESADLLIGADGVRSRVRAAIMPEAAAPRDTSMVSIGGFCSRHFTPPADPDDRDRLTFVSGRRFQLGYSKMSATEWGWWCHVHRDDPSERDRFLKMPEADLKSTMRERYRDWVAPVADLIETTETWLRTPIYDVPTLPTWGRGRVLLVGDAAHAMSPAGGQGASLALEDAWVLGKLVEDPGLGVREAMVRFESLRRARAEKLVAQGYENDRRSLKELGAVGMWMRDRVLMPIFASFIEKGLNEVYTTPWEPTRGAAARRARAASGGAAA